MLRIIAMDSGSYGFQVTSGSMQIMQEFYPFVNGVRTMTEAEARQIGEAFDSPAGPYWDGTQVVPRVVVITDKDEVKADGLDTATITATVADSASSELVTFRVGGQDVASVPCTNGIATFGLTMTSPGDATVEVVSEKYGINSVVVRGV